MDNGTLKEVVSQFDAISVLPDYWDHNRQYQSYLLNKIQGHKALALDIGCGTGELTKKVSEKCTKVIGIDISACMIEEAKKRNSRSNIEYFNTDIDSFLDSTNDKFDVVISVAVFHHLDMERIFKKLKSKLSKGGIILILDLYKNNSLFEHFLSVIASVFNPLFYLVKRGSLKNTKEEKEAWKDHFKYDEYNSIKKIKETAQKTLGNVTITHHLFWRYSLVYVN